MFRESNIKKQTARFRSSKWNRNWGFGSVTTAICGLAAVQFVFFPALTTPDRDISSNPTRNQSAQDRVNQIKQHAQQANDHQDLLELIQSANAARPVNIVQDIQSAAPESSQATSTPPDSSPPGAAQPPTDYGKNWGKESQPALRNFSRWAKDYANAPPPQQAQMLPEGLQLAQHHR
ncbi:MAG: hypothetical protein VX945_05900, partial [Verrucomicrobiota bacterium]|nr:hypothetical protein [Verrucomicrobiota bacterium]